MRTIARILSQKLGNGIAIRTTVTGVNVKTALIIITAIITHAMEIVNSIRSIIISVHNGHIPIRIIINHNTRITVEHRFEVK